MKFIEEAQRLVKIKEVTEVTTNFLGDSVDTILGSPVAAGRILIALAKFPCALRERLFWGKIEAFLDGVYLNEDDRGKLRAKLVEKGDKGDNPQRLLACIERVETQRKIQYLINVTRCLLTDFIELPDYFRICHMITYTLDEDLQFLREHIGEKELSYSVSTQSLMTAGLMYQSVVESKGNQRYSFLPIAEQVDRYAVSYNDVQRYPNPKASFEKDMIPQISLPDTEIEAMTKEEIEKIVEDNMSWNDGDGD